MYVERYGLKWFDPGVKCWTPSWDDTAEQPKEVKACKLQDGTWHEFENMVSMNAARNFQAANGGVVLS